MKPKSIVISIFVSFVPFVVLAQRANIKDQERVQRDYQREHSTQERNGHKVTTDRHGNVTETWVSPNGDRNTYKKSSDGRVTTTVEHPDGTKDVNGVRQESKTHGGNQGGENRGGGNQGSGNQGGGNQGGNKGGGNQGGNKGGGNQGGGSQGPKNERPDFGPR